MAEEYIKRESAIEAIENDCLELVYYTKEDAIQCVKAIPAADVVKVRYGRWEAWMPDKNGETREFICTGCRFMVEMSWKQKECDYEWCPYCGCKMDKEEK